MRLSVNLDAFLTSKLTTVFLEMLQKKQYCQLKFIFIYFFRSSYRIHTFILFRLRVPYSTSQIMFPQTVCVVVRILRNKLLTQARMYPERISFERRNLQGSIAQRAFFIVLFSDLSCECTYSTGFR